MPRERLGANTYGIAYKFKGTVICHSGISGKPGWDCRHSIKDQPNRNRMQTIYAI